MQYSHQAKTCDFYFIVTDQNLKMDKILQIPFSFIGLGHYPFFQNLAAVIQLKNHHQIVSCTPHDPRWRCNRDQNIILTGGMGRRERSLDPSRCNFKLWNSTLLNIAWKENYWQPDFFKEVAASRKEKKLNNMRPKVAKKTISGKKKNSLFLQKI